MWDCCEDSRMYRHEHCIQCGLPRTTLDEAGLCKGCAMHCFTCGDIREDLDENDECADCRQLRYVAFPSPTGNARKYTVVGLHLDDIDRDPEEASYVEWVTVITTPGGMTGPDLAAFTAKNLYEDREDSFIVAVFEGHIIDVRNDKGLDSRG